MLWSAPFLPDGRHLSPDRESPVMPLPTQHAESAVPPVMSSGAANADAQEAAPACSTVFFDNSCPLCRREIALYRGLPADKPLDWQDVSSVAPEGLHGIPQAQLMRRFHVRTASGEMLSGARAFAHVWAQLPGWRYLALLFRIPGVPLLMEGLYRLFLLVRPAVQAVVRRIDARSR